MSITIGTILEVSGALLGALFVISIFSVMRVSGREAERERREEALEHDLAAALEADLMSFGAPEGARKDAFVVEYEL